jgi:DNA-binding NtrC family response regulator
MLLQERGELDAAEQFYKSLRTSRLASVFGAEATLRLAEIHSALGHVDRARELVEEAEVGERALYRGLADLVRAELLVDSEPEKALQLANSAYQILREAGEKNEPVRARLVIAQVLQALERSAQAQTELARELDRVREVATQVPERFRTSFWSKPLHRKLVEALREQDGDVPDDCVVSEKDCEQEPERELESAEFRAWRKRYDEIVGEDPRLHHVFRMIDRVANSDATVLIHGESGTGKELVASALHRRSDRTGKPFVKVNCAAFVENLLLSELFGHEKGAFTGAHEQKIGRFEMADGGTIFLDEIGDISANTQVALLRVLQEGTFERVGGSETMQTDVRVVCATNKDLEAMVKRGEFRLDLYYRLKGVVIEMPPLRERREDIGRLANHFARVYSPDVPKGFSSDALRFLASYSWPGNVRELQNFVRSILLFVDGATVEFDDIQDFREFFASGEIDPTLPDIDFSEIVEVGELTEEPDHDADGQALYAYDDPADALVEKIVAEGQSLSDIKKQLEMECIKRALIETGGNVTRAAEILQMKRPRLSQIVNGDDELAELKTRLAG